MSNAKKTALVLSGGSIKGAFQAGALQKLLADGVRPNAIYGVSVGSLNGGFLADRAGRATLAGAEPDWPSIGSELESFWEERIDSFRRIGKQRSKFSLLCSVIRSNYNGAIDTRALKALVNDILSEDNLAAAELIFKVGAVNVVTGELIQADKHNSAAQLREFIIASTAIPFVMPPSLIAASPYVDGGARDVAPLHQAIRDGAEEIYCILCQEQKTAATTLKIGSLIQFGERVMEIVTNEMVNNDLERAQTINDLLDEDRLVPVGKSGDPEFRKIDLHVIRPTSPLNIELTDFSPTDIRRLIKLGQSAVGEAMKAT